MESVLEMSAVLSAATLRLCDLLGEDAAELIGAAIVTPGSATATQGPPAVLASISENVGRLVTTVEGATTEDWYRTRPDHGVTAVDLVWSALHEATHHLEDAELSLRAALAAGATVGAGANGQPG